MVGGEGEWILYNAGASCDLRTWLAVSHMQHAHNFADGEVARFDSGVSKSGRILVGLPTEGGAAPEGRVLPIDFAVPWWKIFHPGDVQSSAPTWNA